MPGDTSFTLTADLARAVRDSVEAGDFPSVDDALRDAVRVWRRERDEQPQRLESIRAKIRHSLADPRPDLTLAEGRAWLDELDLEAEPAKRREAL